MKWGRQTSVDDLAAVEVGQSVQDALCYLAQHLFSGSTTEFLDFAIDAVQAASFAEFHGDGNRTRRFVHEGAVVLADVVGRAVFVEFELAEDLLLDVWIWTGGYDL